MEIWPYSLEQSKLIYSNVSNSESCQMTFNFTFHPRSFVDPPTHPNLAVLVAELLNAVRTLVQSSFGGKWWR